MATTTRPPAVDAGDVHRLAELGLTPYQARVVAALIAAAPEPLTSAQITEVCGVPRTSVYLAAEALVRAGVVEAVPSVGPKVWRCEGWHAVLVALDARAAGRFEDHVALSKRIRAEVGA